MFYALDPTEQPTQREYIPSGMPGEWREDDSRRVSLPKQRPDPPLQPPASVQQKPPINISSIVSPRVSIIYIYIYICVCVCVCIVIYFSNIVLDAWRVNFYIPASSKYLLPVGMAGEHC